MTRTRTHLGLQIPNFSYPGVDDRDLFERVAAIAVTAEDAGFDTVFVMDHFFQLPQLGTPDREMFEAYTLLAALAARTKRARLGTLVTGVTYRNPALLAKEVTAVDVISGGRALLGIGAAWFELEHDALGYRFPPLAERYERLEEAIQICRSMFTERQSTFGGEHHSVAEAWNSPAPRTPGGPPILVGGSGEKKTFRIAAQHADELNVHAPFAELPRKLDALQGHLDRLGRDRSDINVTCLGTLIVAPSHDEAEATLAGLLRSRGVDEPSTVIDDEAARRALLPRFVWGDPDEVAEQVVELRSVGLDGVVFNMVADGHDLDRVALAGKTLSAALG